MLGRYPAVDPIRRPPNQNRQSDPSRKPMTSINSAGVQILRMVSVSHDSAELFGIHSTAGVQRAYSNRVTPAGTAMSRFPRRCSMNSLGVPAWLVGNEANAPEQPREHLADGRVVEDHLVAVGDEKAEGRACPLRPIRRTQLSPLATLSSAPFPTPGAQEARKALLSSGLSAEKVAIFPGSCRKKV